MQTNAKLEELQLLSALGFGLDSTLMNEPKLLIDSAFLAGLQREFFDELGGEGAARAFFHIGAIHGLRDARRIDDSQPERDGLVPMVGYSPLVMDLGAQTARDGLIEVAGGWPDHFEANARLSKLGASEHPSCSLSTGYTSGWLSGSLGRDVVAVETTCRAAGDARCSFVARDQTSGSEGSEAHDSDRLSLGTLRAVAYEASGNCETVHPHESAASLIAEVPGLLNPEDPAVHLWGPVMVMPFAGPEASHHAIELMSQDEAMRAVRVVVLDLCGAVLDEGFDTAALESLLEKIQSQDAEVILSGISPLSEHSLEGLCASPLLCRKDLPQAIAYAFQIAEAQRHLL
ncbi:MAG: V4R domain-containing protein [Myxococcota bacterium]|nr:V4R domain-containing protein [Myxococcota bacterium]